MVTTVVFTHALFDLDGTLVHSIAQVEEAWQLWGNEYRVSPGIFGHGQTAAAAVRRALPEAEVAAALRRLCDLEVMLATSVRARPGALDLLGSLPVDAWGVVTSAERTVAQARLRAAGIVTPRVFVTGDDVSAGKPHPEGYQRARTRLNRPGACVAFEDTSVGAAAARAADCYTVGVVGVESVDELARTCDAVVPELSRVRLATTADLGDHFMLEGLGLDDVEESDSCLGKWT